MKITIYGANETGCLIATAFFEDHDITVIDKDEHYLNEFSKLDIRFVNGNAANIKVLQDAQINETDLFIACSTVDEANIVACLTVKKMSRACCVCFVSKNEYIESLALIKDFAYHSGLSIDNVIWPEELLTQEIFRIITVPSAIDVEYFAQGKARLLEYRINENSKILNNKIRNCKFPDETLIVGITRDNKLFIPDGETKLELNDKVIFMGSSKSLDILASNIFSNNSKVKSVTIIGGGSVGLMLAQQLENINIKTKIIEKDKNRCEEITEELKKALVLHGDGTDLELLKNESIEDSDVVVSVTNNDEKNLLCSLLTKQMGVKKVITRVNKLNNVNLFEKVGIDVAVSPRDSAIKEIKNDFIETDLEILATVERGQGEILEIQISNNFHDKTLMELNMPVKAIIAVIQRGYNIIIPKGNTKLKSHDRIIIFTTKENSAYINEYFEK